jgi:hypothetical protein
MWNKQRDLSKAGGVFLERLSLDEVASMVD